MHHVSKTLLCALALILADVGAARADDTLRRAQQALHDQGFYYGTVDGAPGDETTQAIRRYQIRNGLAVTGQLNEETQQSLGTTGSPAATQRRPRQNTAAADEDRRYANGPTPAPAVSDDEEEPPPARPDLRVTPPDRIAPGGVRPSATLTDLLAGTPYEFAPPPVQSDVVRRAQIALLRGRFYAAEPDGVPGDMTASALAAFQSARGLRRTGRLDAATLDEMRLMPGRRLVPAPPVRRYPPVFEGRIVR